MILKSTSQLLRKISYPSLNMSRRAEFRRLMNLVLAATSAARTLALAYTVSNLWSHGISSVWRAKGAEAANPTTQSTVVEVEAVGVPPVVALMEDTEATVEDGMGDAGLAVAGES